MKKLFELLKMNGGKIVSALSCTQFEIAEARASDRFYADDEGIGFVYFDKIQSDIQEKMDASLSWEASK